MNIKKRNFYENKIFFIYILSFVLISSYPFINAYAANSTFYILQSKMQTTIEQNTHIVTLQFTEPSKLGDKYSWLITSESGQLAPSLCLFNLSPPNLKTFEKDTKITMVQHAINLEKICKEFHINDKTRNNLLTNNIPITIHYYYQSDIENSYPIVLCPYYNIFFTQQNIIKCISYIAKTFIENAI